MGRYLELANQTVEQLYKVSTPCPDDHHFKKEELEMVEELSKVCCQIVLKYQNLARIIGRPDILWSVNKLARAVTKWTRTCEKRVARSISYIHQTSEFEQHCHVGNTAQQCRLGLSQDSDFAGSLEDSKSTSGGLLCIFGSHTLVPTSWTCKKQTSASHTSTEAEIISLDTGLRKNGIPALDLWDFVIEENRETCCVTHHQTSTPTNQTKVPIQHDTLELWKVDCVSSNAKSSKFGAMLYVLEDNEAVIKMIIRSRSPAMRHVTRTHIFAV